MRLRISHVIIALAALLIGFLLGLPHARAQTVDEITSRGTINIGVLIDLPPYALLNDKQEPDGYDIEVAKLLAKYMGVKANLVQLTAPNRIPFLVTNKVDLIVATFGITPERAKQVMFSIPYSAIENTVYGPKGKAIGKIEDLKGLRVGVPRGTVQDVILTRALGCGDPVRLNFAEGRVEPGDRFLLSSDGLTNALDEAALGRLLGRPDAADALVEAALAARASDNVTAVIADA